MAVFVVVFFFGLSAGWAAVVGLPGRFFAGTIFPHVLQDRIDEEPERIKSDLVDALSRSYYHNNQAFIKRGRHVKIAGWMQLVAMGALVVIVIIEVVTQVFSMVVK